MQNIGNNMIYATVNGGNIRKKTDMKIKTLLQLFIIMTTLLSCLHTTTESKVEKAVSELTDKYPQLRKGKSKQTEYYRLKRTITYGENEFHIQLRSEPDSLNDPQQILVFINSKNECCAIPFFSNTYRDYWEFKYEKTIPKIKRTNTTFTKEFISALNSLNLNDTLGTQRKVIGELFYSLLQCTNITETDSTKILLGCSNENSDLENEIFEKKTNERFRRNYNEISKDWNKYENFKIYNSCYDENNYRIYKFIKEGDYYNSRVNQIKCYRQNAIFNHISI